MDEFKWILVVVLQLTAGTRLPPLYDNAIVGDEVTLACGNVIKDQSDCDSTSWTWTSRSRNPAVELIKLGQIAENTGFKSDRLSVTVNCSLVIKKVTKEDAGLFVCQQYKSDIKEAQDTSVFLSVVSMTEQKNGDEVTLNCSVSTFEECRQTVKWLFEGKDVKQHPQRLRTSYSPCTASVTVLTYHKIYKSRYKSLDCQVSLDNRGHLFPFRLQPSDENPGEVTAESATAQSKSTRPTENSITANDTTESGENDSSKPKGLPFRLQPSVENSGDDTGTNQTEPTTETTTTDAVRATQWRLIVVSVGLSALIITVVTVNVWAKTKGKQTRMDENMVNDGHEDDDAVNYENIRSSAEE